MAVVEVMKEDADSRTKWKWKIRCGDLGWEKLKEEDHIKQVTSTAVPRNKQNPVMFPSE